MKVLIADGSALIRERLAESFKDSKDIAVIGQATNAVETVAEAWKSNPDVVIMDVQMPSSSGIEALQSLKKHKPEIHVVVLTNCDDPAYRKKCMAIGVHAFLDKATEFYRVADILKELTG
jgi:two-component system, NarL family, invasion response regulator UvrY